MLQTHSERASEDEGKEKSQLETYENKNYKNTTWVEKEEAPEKVEIPEDMDNLEFDPSLIDGSVFNIYVEPSPYQDPSKLNLDWVVESMDANQISFQVFFEHNEYISQEGLDTLVTEVRNKDVFLSQKTGG